MSRRAGLMLRTVLWWLIAAVAIVVASSRFIGLETGTFIAFRPLFLVLLYTAFFVGTRYTPGACYYRLSVLHEPMRHFPAEIRRAQDFAQFAGERLLVAGLTFTLADIAVVLYTAGPSKAGALLPATLLSSLYALFLYMLAERTARAALAHIRGG
jgi:hypothetical protein